MITFNPGNKKRMTIRECFEPLQLITEYQEAQQFFIDLYKFIRANKVDYVTGMLSPTQQTILYMDLFISLNKNEVIKAVVKEHFIL